MTKVEAGGSLVYEYHLPQDHMGGTFWYHSHHHGSTALQVGGGLMGPMIVEDEVGDIPDAVLNMPEQVLFLHYVSTELSAIAAEAGDELVTMNYESDGADFLLVNGELSPTLNLVTGQWVRLRMIFAAVDGALEITAGGNLACEFGLLAKDGIYVSDAPRTITAVHLAPGNRADVAMRCNTAGAGTLTSSTARRRRHLMQPGGGRQGPGGNVMDATVVNLNVLSDVVNNEVVDSADPALPALNAKTPDYLADLVSYTGAVEQFEVNFAGGAGGKRRRLAHAHATRRQGGGGGCSVNGVPFPEDHSAIGQINVGTVQEWNVRGNGGHPFHLHVNSYQLQGVTDASGYYQTGDWHDVMLTPDDVTVQRYRFSTDQFTGHAVIHCHFLEHEDEGCMAIVDIVGTEGSTTGLTGTGIAKQDCSA
ncbi:hypothetical protein RI054_19g87840 [Pseudoscourfieldia marina]